MKYLPNLLFFKLSQELITRTIMLYINRKNFWLITTFIVYTRADSPYIANSACGSYSTLPEDFNGSVCMLHFKDSDTVDNITVRSNSDDTSIYFNLMRDKGTSDVWVNVTTKKPLDRETLGSMIKIKLIITDRQHNEIQYEHSVYIIDVNDNIPEFQNLPYKLEINELPCYYALQVFANITATDADSDIYGTITYSMMPKSQIAKQAQDYTKTFSIDRKTGAVTLDACLDFERISYYQFAIVATDGGGLNNTADLMIHVKDVQDEPPFFTGTYRTTINGNIAKGDKIIRVYAVDGDLGLSNEISYSILNSSCGAGLFTIDSHTGVVYAATNISSRSETVSQHFGFCIITIKASEVNTPSARQYGNTTAVTDVIISIYDDVDYTPPHIHSTKTNEMFQTTTDVLTQTTKIPDSCNCTPHTRPTQTNEIIQTTTEVISQTTKIPHSCHEKWDFENPCNKSNVLNGVTKIPHPESIYKFLICDVSGKTFSANCPRNEVFDTRCSTCVLPNQNLSMSCFLSTENKANPCSKENIMAGNLTFPHPDSTSKYIRCDNEGNAWEEECLSGSFWNQLNLRCMLPEAYNPCHRRGNIVQSLFPHYCNPRVYVQCDHNRLPFVHSCPRDYVFLHYDLTCVPPRFPGSEYLRNTCN